MKSYDNPFWGKSKEAKKKFRVVIVRFRVVIVRFRVVIVRFRVVIVGKKCNENSGLRHVSTKPSAQRRSDQNTKNSGLRLFRRNRLHSAARTNFR